MTDYKTVGRDTVQKKLDQWGKRLEGYQEIRFAIKLQKYLNEGNACLRAMAQAIPQERFEEVFQQWEVLSKLVTAMQAEERDEYHRNALALKVRGMALDEEAKKLARIKAFNLEVTGIVLDSRPEGRNRVIVVFDDPDKRGRIYEENDEIRNREDARINGLRVVKIMDGQIRFSYEGTEFHRLIKAP